MKVKWIPQTPDGLILDWLMADSEAEAWEKLGQDDEHQPHNGVAGLLARGYRVYEYEVGDEPQPPSKDRNLT
jgi:hypothetical protein